MNKFFISVLAFAMSLVSLPALAQPRTDNSASAPADTASLGLAGDNLDLYAVMDLFLKSKTIEDFEKSLNDTKSKINNLDLDLDKKIDFIKVVTKKDGDSYTFVLQDAVSKTETQDVAVILVNRDKDKKINVQIVGDPELYGKDYVIEPKTSPTPAVTSNPAYQGADPVVKDVPASTTTVVVQQAPIVQYVYSPAYVPYYPPYYYGYHPPYFAMATVIAVGIYRHNNWYHHGGYHGGHYGGGNTVVINNRNQINHYNNTRNTSNRVQHNNASGNYGNGNRGGGSAGNRPSTGGPSGSAGGNRPSTGGPSGSAGGNRPSTGGPSASQRPASGGSNFNSRPSSSNNMNSSRSSGSRGGGGYSGGGGRGGGGGGRRR
jgi:hypothetical protein